MSVKPSIGFSGAVAPAPTIPDGVDVLHVDDDDDWSGLVRHWLTARGYRVHCLQSRAEALKYLEGAKTLPRCLLLDLTLQDGDGLEICDRVKESPRLQAMPVVILSGSAGDALACLEHLALYRVDKGVGTERELLAVLRTVFDQVGRAQGLVDVGSLSFEPGTGAVSLQGSRIAVLEPGLFAAFLLMARSAPGAVSDEELYHAFISRHSYKKQDPELSRLLLVRNYVSRLRSRLGPVLGSRIVRRKDGGYAYGA